MARVFTQAEAKQLGLPGRKALEIVSGEKGALGVTLRLAEIPVPQPGESPRGPHQHSDHEECIYVLSGKGTTFADSGEYKLNPGDALLIPPGEKHVTRNTGNEPLLLLCFFPRRRYHHEHRGARRPFPDFSSAMTLDVLCLRPEADFQRAGAVPPSILKIAYRSPEDSDIHDLMKQARALVIPAVGPKLPSSLFENSSAKFVQVTGAGLDRLDLPALKRLGISVANVPGGSNSAVAEYAVTAASILLRRFACADAEIRAGHYREFRARMVSDNLAGLDGLVVGIVGLGVIGLAVAEVFHKRGCQIFYHDPAPRDPQAAASLGAISVSLNELWKGSDVITLHVPLLPATQGLVGEHQLAAMKPGAILINASRGGIVDEAALAHSLQSGHLGGAAIDVYADEPPPPNNPLLQLEGEAARRILFTPHIAGVTRQSAAFLFRAAWRNIERVLIEKVPPLDPAL